MRNEEYLPEYVRMCLQSSQLRNSWHWNYGDKFYDPATDAVNHVAFMANVTTQCIPLPSLEQLHVMVGGEDMINVLLHQRRIDKDIELDISKLNPSEPDLLKKYWLKHYKMISFGLSWNGVNWEKREPVATAEPIQ